MVLVSARNLAAAEGIAQTLSPPPAQLREILLDTMTCISAPLHEQKLRGISNSLDIWFEMIMMRCVEVICRAVVGLSFPSIHNIGP